MKNDALHRYFAGVLRLRKLLQAQESLEKSWKKIPFSQRFLWVLPAASFGAVFVTGVLVPFAKQLWQKLK